MLAKCRVSFKTRSPNCGKVSFSFVMSVRPFSVPTGWIFMKFDILILKKSMENIQVPLKSDKDGGYFT